MSCDPRLDEFLRANELRPQFFRNLQSYVRTVVIPRLEERERLLEEVQSLRARMARGKKAERTEEQHAGV